MSTATGDSAPRSPAPKPANVTRQLRLEANRADVPAYIPKPSRFVEPIRAQNWQPKMLELITSFPPRPSRSATKVVLRVPMPQSSETRASRRIEKLDLAFTPPAGVGHPTARTSRHTSPKPCTPSIRIAALTAPGCRGNCVESSPASRHVTEPRIYLVAGARLQFPILELSRRLRTLLPKTVTHVHPTPRLSTKGPNPAAKSHKWGLDDAALSPSTPQNWTSR